MSAVAEPATATAQPDAKPKRPRGLLVESLGVLLLNIVVITPLLRLWRADFHVPFLYDGDGLFNLGVARTMIDHSWFTFNPDLGAPFGQHLADFGGLSDNLTFVTIKALAAFSSSPAVIVNVLYVGSFPVIAVVAFLVMRHLGIRASVAAVCATLYTLAPYHFFRGEGHLFLALYYAVPVGLCLVLDLMARRPLFRRRAGGPRVLAWASRRSCATVAMCVVVASGGIYYTVFVLILLVSAVLIGALTDWRRASFAAAGAIAVVIVGVTLLNMGPTLLYHHEHGDNPSVGQRYAAVSEVFALKLVGLVLPVAGHHVDALDRLQARYQTMTRLPGEATQSLGVVATCGFIWLLLLALRATVVGARRPRSPPRRLAELDGHLAFLCLVAFLVGTTGGVSAIIAFNITPSIRAWGRISIVIAFLALVAVALLLERLSDRFGGARRGRLATGAVLTGILLIGIYDQTNYTFVPRYDAIAAEHASDAKLVSAIERQMPRGAAIMQLPYVPFPENGPVGAMPDYELLRPWLHSTDLRWSYGGIKGRPDDWQAAFFGVPPEQLLLGMGQPAANGRLARRNIDAIAAAGFDGVYVDRFGFGGLAVGPAEHTLQRVLGAPSVVSVNGRMAFYSLRAYTARLRREHSAAWLRALRESTLRPPAAGTS